jgi:Peptidase family S58
MLANNKVLDRHRVEFLDCLTPKEVHELASNPSLRVLQTASPVSFPTWELLNQNLFALRPDIELRVYGFYSSTCDLSFVKGMSNVRRFSADCLMTAIGIEHLATLENLEELSIGIFTGTVAFGWKGGIGTASRRLPASLGGYTVGVLVQTNFGRVLTIAGLPWVRN